MPNLTIAVAVSVVPVGPRKADIRTQQFALHLSAAFVAPQAPSEYDYLVRPWDWYSISNVWIKIEAAAVAAFEGAISNVPRKPLAVVGGLSRLRDLIAAGKSVDWNPAQLQTPTPVNTPSTTDPRLIDAIHTLSLYPGEIPQRSKLVSYFQSQGWPASVSKFAVAPEFVIELRGSGGTRLQFRPRPDFDLNQAAAGWPYNVTVLSGTMPANLTVAARAYVKPTRVAQGAGFVQYDDDPTFTAETVPFGANFKDYWFRSVAVYPWTEKLADFTRAVTDVGALMTQMRGEIEGAKPQVREAWDALRLMALGLYGQWFVPAAAPAGCAIGPNDAAGLAQQVLTNNADATELLSRIQRLNQDLRSGEGRRLWLDIFRRARGDSLTEQQLMQKAEEKSAAAASGGAQAGRQADAFDLLLFHQWDYAVGKYEGQTARPLLAEWRLRTREGGAIKESVVKLFTDDGQDAKPWGATKLARLYGRCVAVAVMQTSKLDDARNVLRAQLKTLRALLDADISPDYHPRLTSHNALGAADWDALWQRWEAFVDKYVAQLSGDPSAETEAKPGGLSLQFDLLREKQTGTAPLDEDRNFWKKLAGLGVLVREVRTENGQPVGDWRSVSAATLNLRGIKVRKVEAATNPPDPRKIYIWVGVPRDARPGRYSLTLGQEVFGYDLALNANGFTLASATAAQPQIAVQPLAPGASDAVFRAKLTVTRTDHDFDPAALSHVVFGELLAGAALVPMRIPYREGVRHPYITYNQRSLVAPSDLANSVRDSFAVKDTGSGLQTPGLYEYGPAWNGNQNFNLVPLKFGRSYEMAAFMIDTAGGLPAELSASEPWVFKGQSSTESLGVPAAAATRAAVVKSYAYWRKVPVGQVRISSLKKTEGGEPRFSERPWPEIAEGVEPLAWEVKLQEDTQADPRAKDRKSQLVLIYDGRDAEGGDARTFVFGVKPPSVDLDVLERWSSTPGELTRLKQVLKDYFERVARRHGDPAPFNAQASDDTSLDDPAVSHILFILEAYDFDEANEQAKWKTVSWYKREVRRNDTEPGINYYQTDWLKVLCRGPKAGESGYKVAAADQQEQADGFDISVVVPRDQVRVVRLRVCATVPTRFIEGSTAGDASPKFRQGFFDLTYAPENPQAFRFREDVLNAYHLGTLTPSDRQALEAFLQQNICLKPFTALVETPNAQLPEDKELWSLLKLELDASAKNVVRVLLEQGNATARPKLRNIVRCEVLKQMWRWQGRPIGSFNLAWAVAGGVGPLKDENLDLLKWELAAFAETDEVRDTLIVPRPYNYHQPNPLFEDSFRADLLAHYARYALRVFSRYEKLFTTARPVVSRQVYLDQTAPARKISGHGWRRVLIPYRGLKPPKPLIKAIVPLTGAYADETGADAATSLMLALDETMFSHCGVTEHIECEVEVVEIPSGEQPLNCGAGGTRRRLHQAGPDPIVSPIQPAPGAPNPACELPNADNVIRLDLVGPFGHTFDTGARAPLYGSSSLIVRPFQQDGARHRFRPWNFVKLRFRRKSGNHTVDATLDEKDWNQPLWVQFLPSAEFNVPSWEQEVTVSLDEQNRTITLAPRGTQTFFKELVNPGLFQYCLVLTRVVQDYRGVSGQEIYVDYLRLRHTNDEKGLTGDLRPGMTLEGALKGRLLEIQTAPRVNAGGVRFFDPIPEGDLWKDLLKNDRDEDAKYRVTRISPAFKIR